MANYLTCNTKKLKLHLLVRLMMGHFMNYRCFVVTWSQQQWFAVKLVRARQMGNVDNTSAGKR